MRRLLLKFVPVAAGGMMADGGVIAAVRLRWLRWWCAPPQGTGRVGV